MATSARPIIQTMDVHITQHAQEQLLLRYPDDVLPRNPETFLRGLIGQGQLLPPRLARRFSLSLHPDSRILGAGRWVLVLAANRMPPPAWALVTILRRNLQETNVPLALRQDRLTAHTWFRSGQAFRALESLIAEIGPSDLVGLARLWYARRYPSWLYGGYRAFEAFYRDYFRSKPAAA